MSWLWRPYTRIFAGHRVKTRRLIKSLQMRNYVHLQGNTVHLTSKGKNRVRTFRETQLARETVIQ